MKTIKCPICNGDGDIEIPHYHSYDGYWASSRKCHNCDGSGEIEVEDDFDEEEDYVEEMSYKEYKQAQKEAAEEYRWECENER